MLLVGFFPLLFARIWNDQGLFCFFLIQVALPFRSLVISLFFFWWLIRVDYNLVFLYFPDSIKKYEHIFTAISLFAILLYILIL